MFQHQTDDQIRAAAIGSAARDRTIDVEAVLQVTRQRRDVEAASVPTEAELRAEEYMALRDGNVGGATDAFHCQQVDVDPSISDVVAQVSKVSRLREVRALHGFARVSPTGSSSDAPRLASLSIKRLHWLPAVEVFGEGVFVRLDPDALQRWEETPFASQRIGALTEAVRRRAQESGANAIEPPSPRFVAVHTVAHAVLKELSLDAGYPTGALRERIFADGSQAGFLIYTASSDAAGSLGGLAALAEEARFAAVFESATSRSGWCSNDPVCAESGPSGSDGLNLAACHACLLLPETSCEERNMYLDRVSLVGDPRDSSGGLLTGI
ncbi:hypothetical protein N802_06895 [Knoellia sinensis KCTC 19936]|uniref:MrfA-like Zn-binding domain-containing protein n=1 Tax=Knoellia sinensis KCTC 19936 TaxID=1385520 RepID=A0A0A0J0G8_9MICO|nr:hypothetical protein N802_06895 [Knoellia sinensis KCTC 19936]